MEAPKVMLPAALLVKETESSASSPHDPLTQTTTFLNDEGHPQLPMHPTTPPDITGDPSRGVDADSSASRGAGSGGITMHIDPLSASNNRSFGMSGGLSSSRLGQVQSQSQRISPTPSTELGVKTYCAFSGRGAPNVVAWASGHCNNAAGNARLAIGSYTTTGRNYIEIIDFDITSQTASRAAITDVPLPPTKVGFSKFGEASAETLITTGDALRVWNIEPTTFDIRSRASSLPGSHVGTPRPSMLPSPAISATTSPRANHGSKPMLGFIEGMATDELYENSRFPAQDGTLYTSFDCCDDVRDLIVTSCTDGAVTVWDLGEERQLRKSRVHQQAAFDVAYAGSRTLFSCGADGAIYRLDLRSAEEPTKVFDLQLRGGSSVGGGGDGVSLWSPNYTGGGGVSASTPRRSPLIRLAVDASKSFVATIEEESQDVTVLDVRMASRPLATSVGSIHVAPVNALQWHPTRRGVLLTAGEDRYVAETDFFRNNGLGPMAGLVGGSGSTTGTLAGLTEDVMSLSLCSSSGSGSGSLQSSIVEEGENSGSPPLGTSPTKSAAGPATTSLLSKPSTEYHDATDEVNCISYCPTLEGSVFACSTGLSVEIAAFTNPGANT